MAEKPPFDPTQPFEAVPAAAPAGGKPPFDPSKPFEAAPAAPQGSAVMRGVTQAATGANEGLASTVGRALDVVPYFASRAMGGEGVHPVEGFLRKYFVDPMGEPANNVEKTLRAGGKMAGENMTALVPTVAAATSGVRAGIPLAEQAAGGIVPKIRGAADSVLDFMAKKPAATAIGDTVGAFEAGAGGDVAKGVAKDKGYGPEGQAVAELASQLMTPAATSFYAARLSPVMWAMKGGPKIADKALEFLPETVLPASLRPSAGTPAERQAERLAWANREGKYADSSVPPPANPNYFERRAEAGYNKRTQAAGQTVGKEVNAITAKPEAAAGIAETEALKKDIPGFEPGLARATNDSGLLNLQNKFGAEASGQELRDIQARDDASSSAIRQRLESMVPKAEAPKPESFVGPKPATDTPQDSVDRALLGRVNDVNAKIEGKKAETTKAIQDVSQSLPETDPSAVGEYLRTTRADLRKEADARMGELRRNIDPSGKGVVELPPVTPDGEPVTMSVNQALNRRAQINQDLADHYGASNRDQAAVRDIRRLQSEKDTLDAAIERASGGIEGLKAYNDYYRNEYAPRFLQGASRDVGRFNRNGYEGNRVASEDVPGAFFKPNNISEARQFNKLYGENPEARGKMTDYALDDLRRAVIDPNTGQIREGAVNKWLAKNERVLNEMPWVRDAVSAKNPDDLYRRLGELNQRQSAVADAKVTKLLGKTPERQIDAALNDWQIMRGLRRSVAGDPQAEAALRRAVWDRVVAQGGKDTLLDATKMRAFLEGNKRSLSQVLTPEHMADLNKVLRAAEIQGRAPRPTGTVEAPQSASDKIGGAVGMSVPSIATAGTALARGRSSPVYEVGNFLARAFHKMSKAEVESAWKTALFDPKVAKDLATGATSKSVTPIQMSRMINYLATVGAHDTRENLTGEQ